MWVLCGTGHSLVRERVVLAWCFAGWARMRVGYVYTRFVYYLPLFTVDVDCLHPRCTRSPVVIDTLLALHRRCQVARKCKY